MSVNFWAGPVSSLKDTLGTSVVTGTPHAAGGEDANTVSHKDAREQSAHRTCRTSTTEPPNHCRCPPLVLAETKSPTPLNNLSQTLAAVQFLPIFRRLPRGVHRRQLPASCPLTVNHTKVLFVFVLAEHDAQKILNLSNLFLLDFNTK